MSTLQQALFFDSDVDNLWLRWYDIFMITVFAKRPFLCAQIYLISPRISYVRLKRSSLFFNQAKHLNFDNAWAAYNKVRNQVTSALHTAKKKFFTQERLVSIYYKQRWLESSTLLNPRMKKLAFSDVGAAEKASRHITSESETESESSQILYLLMKKLLKRPFRLVIVVEENIYGSFYINSLVNQLQDAIYYWGYNRMQQYLRIPIIDRKNALVYPSIEKVVRNI